MDKRISESIVPEVKEKIKRHLEQTKGQQERLKERIKTLGGGMEPTSEKGQLPIPQPPHKLKLMIERQQFRERKRSLGIVKRFDNRTSRSYYVKGGIQALELLKIDKKTIKALEKNLKEEQAFGDWLEKNNPRIAKRLMTKQIHQKTRGKKRKTTQEKEEQEVSATAA